LQNKAKLTQLGQSGQFHPSFLRQKRTSDFTHQKNEPKTNPIQTQTKPIFWLLYLTIFGISATMDKPEFLLPRPQSHGQFRAKPEITDYYCNY
jgi:hypothetical protein